MAQNLKGVAKMAFSFTENTDLISKIADPSPKEMLEKAYGKPLSEAEFQAISRNLSEFFHILAECKKKREQK